LPQVEQDFFDMKKFWLRSTRRASLARALAQLLHPTTQAESFAIGLLQDMGLPVLVNTHPNKYKEILELWNETPHKPLHIIEREYFDFDHFTIGGLMAGEWKLPDKLVAAISRDNPSEIDLSLNILAFIPLEDEELIKQALIRVCVESHNLEEEVITQAVEEALAASKELSALLR
jgi:HD-like signal output (HDOD) protein